MNRAVILKRVYAVLIILVAAAIMVIGSLTLGPGNSKDGGNIRDLSGGWQTEGGETALQVAGMRAADHGGHITVSRTLPDDVTDADAICFETININVDVLVEGRKIYSFTARENLTGAGYGYCFHTAGLSAADAGHTVTLDYEWVSPEASGGQIVSIYLCPAGEYIQMNVANKNFPHMVSVLIVYFGAIMVLIYSRISEKNLLPFDAGAFGFTAIFIGSWLLVDTNILQLLTGDLYFSRVTSRTLIFLAAYPMVTFINSMTRLKRRIYLHIAFFVSIAIPGVLVLLRYFAGIDMINSYSVGIAVFAVVLVALIAVIFADNAAYCRKNGMEVKLKAFYIGAIFMLLCCLGDFVLFALQAHIGDSYGSLSRIGTLVLMLVLMIRFFGWWTRDQATVERERFVNNTLKYAMASDEPETGLKSMMDYMGNTLEAKRVLVFEDQMNGRFHGVYEWFEEGLETVSPDLIYLPAGDFSDRVHRYMKSNGSCLAVDDVEAWRTMNPTLYNLIRANGVDRLVAGPLEDDGRLFGFLALIDLPHEKMEEASEAIGLVSYFLSQLILHRDAQKRLKNFTYNDPLTGALKRQAYKEFVNERLDTSLAFGYLVCEILGLEAANYSVGYEAGDEMVKAVAACITDVFGKEHSFRVGGTQFVAFGFETDEIYFRNDIERVRKLAKEKEVSITVGGVYCLNGTMDMNIVIDRAHELLQQDKAAATVPSRQTRG